MKVGGAVDGFLKGQRRRGVGRASTKKLRNPHGRKEEYCLRQRHKEEQKEDVVGEGTRLKSVRNVRKHLSEHGPCPNTGCIGEGRKKPGKGTAPHQRGEGEVKRSPVRVESSQEPG